jgi:hypothetical protein
MGTVMKRRGFLGALLGLVVAPTAALKARTSKQDTLPDITEKPRGLPEFRATLVKPGMNRNCDIFGVGVHCSGVIPSNTLSEILRIGGSGSYNLIWGPELDEPPKEPSLDFDIKDLWHDLDKPYE